MTHVQRDNPNVIAADQIRILLAVVECEGEHALQVVKEFRPFLLVQREDNFTVGTGLELIAIAVFST